MAKKMIGFPGHASLWMLRLFGAMVTFVFTFFVYTSGQVIQYAGAGKPGVAKAAGKTALPGDSVIPVPSYGIRPIDSVIALYGMPHADFSIKGKIRSEAGNAPIKNIKIVATDTSTKQIVDSAITQEDGSFSMTFTRPSWYHTWVIDVRDIDGDQNGAFFAKDTLVSIPLDSLRGGTGFYSGAASADIELFLENRTSVISGDVPGITGSRPALDVSVLPDLSLALRYTLPVQGRAAISLFSASGRLLREISDKWESAGGHNAAIPAAGLSAGTYFLRVQTATHAAIAKVRFGR
jgi:putative lipoprotein (rSAM/lipoprotein system)